MLLGCVTFLISSCTNFSWDAQPWSGDSYNSRLVKYTGETMSCDQPAFDKMTCFDEVNMAELKTEISKVSSKRLRRKLLKIFKGTKKRR